MSRPYRKLVAIILMLWLPLFSGNALAASVLMQIPSSHCHDETVSSMSGMNIHDMDEQQMPASSDDSGTSCHTCGICHLACSGYVAMTEITPSTLQLSELALHAGQISFRSLTFAPLVPPPLTRA
jgi:ferredoxin